MSLKQPPGRIIENTGIGQLPNEKVDPVYMLLEEISYLSGNRIHRCIINGKPVEIHRLNILLNMLDEAGFFKPPN